MSEMWMGVIDILVGLFMLGGAIGNWDWFMNNRRARFVVAILSRTGARIFYGLLGAFFVLLGLLAMTGVLSSG
ncbi:MAG TPA: immunity 17 family protein [Anaerolineae bacterium]|nr:immunity 17 family protein [Anaerolineae bacterium]